MKITQLDYSAIRAANSAQANANSMALAVETQKHNNLMTKYNVEYTDKYIKAVNKENNAKRWIQFGTDVANLALKGAEIGIKYKDQADGETASNAITDAADALNNTYNQEYQNNAASFFDADNNIVKPQAIIDQENAIRNSIQNLNIGNGKKEEALAAVDEMFSKAWSDVGEQLAGREIQARNEAWTTRLNDALEVDSTLGTPDNGLEMIQNTGWLTPAEKDNYSLQYKNSFEARVQSNEVSRLARESGEETANDYIKGLSIDETAKNTLYSLADSIAKDGDENAQGNMQSYVQQQLEKGIFPVVIAEMVEPQLENMDPSRREAVETVMHQEFYKNALQEFNWPADMSSLTGPELKTLSDDINDRGTALLPDMKTELAAMKAAVQKELDTRTTANAKANVQSMDLVFDAVGAGTISPAAGLAMIREIPVYNDSDTSDDEKAAEYMKKLADQENFVPQHVQYTYKNRISLLEDSIKQTLGLDIKNAEDYGTFIQYADQARSYVLDYIWNTPAEDITAASLNEAFDRANEIFLGGTIQELEEIRSDNEGRTLIQQGFSDLGTGYLEDVTNLLMQMPEGMISLNPNGQYESPSPLVTNYWGELEIAERNLVQQLNLGDPKNWTTTPYKRTNADGSTTEVPIPVLQSPDGTRYTIVGNEFLKQEKDNDQWDVITTINKSAPLPADDTITPPTAEQIQEGQDSIDVSNPPDIDDYKDPWVLPTPQEVQQGQQSVVIDEDEDAFAHLADEGGDIRIRRVKGQGTQFYHNGIWYRVNQLPENSPILKAYDEYMKTFTGTIPKVGY